MISFKLRAAGFETDAALGFEPPTDATALHVRIDAIALRAHPDPPSRVVVALGDPSGPNESGWTMIARAPGLYEAPPEWAAFIRSQAVFGRVALHVICDDAPPAIVEIDLPMEERWRALYEALVAAMKADPDAEASLRSAAGVGRARLELWRSQTPGEIAVRIAARAVAALSRIAVAPDGKPRDGGGRSPHPRGGARVVAAIPEAFRTGAFGLSSTGRPLPLLFPVEDAGGADYDTPANRAARWLVERLIRAADERASYKSAVAADRVAGASSHFGDDRAARRAAHVAARLKEAARALRVKLANEPFLRDAARVAAPTFPNPAPHNPGYRVLRAAAADEAALRRGDLDVARIRQLFDDAEHDAPSLADLYERWTGVVVAAALRAEGFAPERETATPTPGGPPVTFRSGGGARLAFFAAPAIRRNAIPIRGAEITPPSAADPRTVLTPDFVLQRLDGDAKRPLLILDATLSSSPEILRRKALYGRRLVATQFVRRLGALRRPPVVSCAAAVYPGRGAAFEADDVDLRSGALPLRPGDPKQFDLLREFLRTFLEGAAD